MTVLLRVFACETGVVAEYVVLLECGAGQGRVDVLFALMAVLKHDVVWGRQARRSNTAHHSRMLRNPGPERPLKGIAWPNWLRFKSPVAQNGHGNNSCSSMLCHSSSSTFTNWVIGIHDLNPSNLIGEPEGLACIWCRGYVARHI